MGYTPPKRAISNLRASCNLRLRKCSRIRSVSSSGVSAASSRSCAAVRLPYFSSSVRDGGGDGERGGGGSGGRIPCLRSASLLIETCFQSKDESVKGCSQFCIFVWVDRHDCKSQRSGVPQSSTCAVADQESSSSPNPDRGSTAVHPEAFKT